MSLVLVGLAAVAGCESKPTTSAGPAKAEPTASAPAGPTGTTKTYGAPIAGAGERVALPALLGSPANFKGKTVVVEGEVKRACSKKGCWMELSETKATDAPSARVTFKDYGFFVPTDSAGAHARLEGVVNVETMSKGKVEHLEEEGAKIPNKKPDGTAEEVQLVATGVELTR